MSIQIGIERNSWSANPALSVFVHVFKAKHHKYVVVGVTGCTTIFFGRRFLRDFPQTHDPEIDENGETVDDYKLPETLEEFALETKV